MHFIKFGLYRVLGAPMCVCVNGIIDVQTYITCGRAQAWMLASLPPHECDSVCMCVPVSLAAGGGTFLPLSCAAASTWAPVAVTRWHLRKSYMQLQEVRLATRASLGVRALYMEFGFL